MKKKIEKMSTIVYTAAGMLVGCAIGGTVMSKIQNKPQQDAQPVTADVLHADLSAETTPVQTFPTTTMTFTVTTTTTTTIFTTMTTTTTAPPPPPLDIQQVSAVLMPAKESLSMNYHYTDSDTYEYYSEWGGFRLPFTTESARYTYEGVIKIGIDPARIEMVVDNYFRTITIKLPEPEILSNELDENSIRYYDVQTPLFGGSGMNDYRGMIKRLKDKQADKVMRDTAFLNEVISKAEMTLRSFLMQSEKTADFKVQFGDLPVQDSSVSFEFLPSVQDSPAAPENPMIPEEPEEDYEEGPVPFDPNADIAPIVDDPSYEPYEPALPDLELEIPDAALPDEPETPAAEPSFEEWSADPTGWVRKQL